MLTYAILLLCKKTSMRSPCGDGQLSGGVESQPKKNQRSLNGNDMLDALKTLQSRSEEIFGERK